MAKAHVSFLVRLKMNEQRIIVEIWAELNDIDPADETINKKKNRLIELISAGTYVLQLLRNIIVNETKTTIRIWKVIFFRLRSCFAILLVALKSNEECWCDVNL